MILKRMAFRDVSGIYFASLTTPPILVLDFTDSEAMVKNMPSLRLKKHISHPLWGLV